MNSGSDHIKQSQLKSRVPGSWALDWASQSFHTASSLYIESPSPGMSLGWEREMPLFQGKALNAELLVSQFGYSACTLHTLSLQGERKNLHPNASKDVPQPTQAPANLTGKSRVTLCCMVVNCLHCALSPRLQLVCRGSNCLANSGCTFTQGRESKMSPIGASI